MPTQVEILQEQMLLMGMGLKPVKIWPPRCQWYNSDGSVNGTLPCDPYSRLLYLSKGLVPEVAMPKATHDNVTLLDAVVDLMSDRPMHEGTASEILNVLEGMVVGLSPVLPLDATRFSIALFDLASQLEGHGIEVRRLTRGRNRGIRLLNRRFRETVNSGENP